MPPENRNAASSPTTARVGYISQDSTTEHCPSETIDSAIIYPSDPYDVQAIVDYLKTVKINPNDESSNSWWDRTLQVQGGGFTAYFFVENLTSTVLDDILRRRELLKAC